MPSRWQHQAIFVGIEMKNSDPKESNLAKCKFRDIQYQYSSFLKKITPKPL